MSSPVDYYVAAIVDAIEQNADAGTREDGACTLPLDVVLRYYSQTILINVRYTLSNSKLLNMALDQLAAGNLVEIWRDDFAETLIYIEHPQLLFDSMRNNEPFQRLYLLKDNGRRWLTGALERINSIENSHEAQVDVREDVPEHLEEEWAPLPIDRQDPKFLEAVMAVEEAIRVIESDNGYAVTAPDERNAIVVPAKKCSTNTKRWMP